MLSAMIRVLVRIIIFIAVTLLILGVGRAYFYYFEKESLVEVAEVGFGPVDEIVRMSGNLDAENTETILANTDGIISDLTLREGNWVKAGEKLCAIRSPELRGKLLEMQAELVTAQESLKRAIAEDEKNIANARLNFIRANIADIEESIEPRAHINGEVIEVNVQNGSKVIGGSKLFFIADMGKPVVKVRLEEADTQKVKEGQPLWIEGDFLSKKRLNGNIYRIGKSVNAENGSYIETTCRIFNPQRLTLKYGAFAEVRVITATKKKVLRIPIEALIVDGKEQAFLVVDGRARQVTIIIGIVGENYVEILSGLKEKDRVVTVGSLDLKDGERIKIRNHQTIKD